MQSCRPGTIFAKRPILQSSVHTNCECQLHTTSVARCTNRLNALFGGFRFDQKWLNGPIACLVTLILETNYFSQLDCGNRYGDVTASKSINKCRAFVCEMHSRIHKMCILPLFTVERTAPLNYAEYFLFDLQCLPFTLCILYATNFRS